MPRQLATAAAGVIRDSHYVLNPVTGLYERSTLLEGSRTNLWSYSADLTNVAWSKNGGTVVADTIRAPDGTSQADKFVESSATELHYFSRATGTFTAGQPQTVSVFIKPAGRKDIRFYLINGGESVGMVVDLTTLVMSNIAGGTSVLIRKGVDVLEDGWYRLWFSGTMGSTITTASMALLMMDGTLQNYPGNGASGIYVWGMQFEPDAPFPASYIPTTSTADTRAAESLWAQFPHAPQAMTLYAKFVERGTGSTPLARLLAIGNGVSLPRLLIASNSTATRYRIYVGNSSATHEVNAPVGTSIGDLVEVRGILYADGSVQIGIAVNGGAEALSVRSPSLVGGLPGAWSGQTIHVGGEGGLTPGFAAFLAVKVAAGIKSMDQMRLLPPVS